MPSPRTSSAVLAAALLCAACADFDRLEAEAKAALPGRDGGAVDAGMGVGDAGEDAGATDAGPLDAGTADAGGGDAGALDAGGLDAGADAGGLDAGPPPRQLELRLRWHRTHSTPAGSFEEPGFVVAVDGGHVVKLATTVTTAGKYFGDVYAWSAATGDAVLVDGGALPVPPVLPVRGDIARAYTEGRPRGVSLHAGQLLVGFEAVLADGGSPQTGVYTYGNHVRRYPVAPFRGQQLPLSSFGGQVPSVVGRLALSDGGLTWPVLTVSTSGFAFWEGGLDQGYSQRFTLSLMCALPTQAFSRGARVAVLGQCSFGTTVAALHFETGVTTYAGQPSGGLDWRLAQPPTGVDAPALLARVDGATSGAAQVVVTQLSVLADGGFDSRSQVVATAGGALRLAALTTDERGRGYLLVELQAPGIAGPSLTPAGADFTLRPDSGWIVLAVSQALDVRWAAGIAVPERWDSNAMAVSEGHVFVEARCRGAASMMGPVDGGFCQPSTGNVLLRLDAADGGPL